MRGVLVLAVHVRHPRLLHGVLAQCCLRCSSLVDSLCRSAYASFVALTASPAAVARGTLVRALLAGVLSQAEVEVHANSGLC